MHTHRHARAHTQTHTHTHEHLNVALTSSGLADHPTMFAGFTDRSKVPTLTVRFPT